MVRLKPQCKNGCMGKSTSGEQYDTGLAHGGGVRHTMEHGAHHELGC